MQSKVSFPRENWLGKTGKLAMMNTYCPGKQLVFPAILYRENWETGFLALITDLNDNH